MLSLAQRTTILELNTQEWANARTRGFWGSPAWLCAKSSALTPPRSRNCTEPRRPNVTAQQILELFDRCTVTTAFGQLDLVFLRGTWSSNTCREALDGIINVRDNPAIVAPPLQLSA